MLIAVIVLASAKVTPPPCPKPATNTSNLDAVAGTNDHLKSGNGNRGPSVGPSRTEGVSDENEDPLNEEEHIEIDIDIKHRGALGDKGEMFLANLQENYS